MTEGFELHALLAAVATAVAGGGGGRRSGMSAKGNSKINVNVSANCDVIPNDWIRLVAFPYPKGCMRDTEWKG